MLHVVIIGCGDIGRRVARQWLARGARVGAAVRSAESAAELGAAGIEAVAIDLDHTNALTGLDPAGTLLYYFAPPPAHGEKDSRARTFLLALGRQGAPARIVYLSTSGVYGDRGGAWVTEDTPPAPETERAQRRLDAERAFQAWGSRHGVPVVILRVGGIYGPGRLPLERIRAGAPVLREDQAPPTNRIHADDLAAACVAAGETGRPDGIYNVCDGQDANMTQYFYAVADAFGLARPPTIDWEQAKRALSPGMLSYLGESRRMDNRRMRELLEVELRYPDLASGLAAIVAEGGAKAGGSR